MGKNARPPSPLKVGVIGCGHIGRLVHLESLRRLPNVELAGLADADPSRLQLARARFPEARTFADYVELLAQPDIEAVVVCLPNALHAVAAIEAFQRGKDVYLEKPLAVDLQEGGIAADAWRRSGRIGMMGFNYRFNPLHRQMLTYIRDGAIGEIIGARSVWTTTSSRMPEWKATRRTGGGVLLDLASHHFDLMRYWFEQDIVEVRADVQSMRSDDDTANVQLRLASGLKIQNFFSLNSIEDERFEIYGSTGKLSFDRFNSWSVELTRSQSRSMPARYLHRALSYLPQTRFAVNKLRAPASEPSFSTALAQFVRAAKEEKKISPDFDDGLRSLAVVIAAEESARSRQPVPVSLNNTSAGGQRPVARTA